MNRKKILVVDDEDDVRKLVVSALETFGFQVFEASNGQEGLQAFLNFAPDLALLDIRMPGIGGVQLCELIRHRSKIPIIMFSAVDEREDVVAAIQKGANDYVLKGSGVAAVSERISRYINTAAEKSSGGKPANGDQKEKWSLKDSDVPVAVLVHSDRKARTEIRDTLRNSQIQVREANTGEEALTVIKRFNPLLVVAEATLSDMTANDLLKTIKEHPRRGGIAVIVASNKRSPEAQRRAIYYGAQDYVHSPWDDGRLAMALRTSMVKAQQYRNKVKQIIAERQAQKQQPAKSAKKKAS
jgi:DNA-binding response OmpR family regulator